MTTFLLKDSKGFTFIEMIVSIGIFTTVLFIAMSAFLSIVNGDHKSRAMRVATDNLNLALEDMSRKIKTGTTYNCGGAVSGVQDCVTGNNILAFTSQDTLSRILYKRGVGPSAIVNGTSASGCGDALFAATQGCILREDAGVSMLATSPELNISNLKFYVFGSAPFGVVAGTDKVQPKVVIVIEGSLGADATLLSGNAGFKIQTTVTQRAYDN